MKKWVIGSPDRSAAHDIASDGFVSPLSSEVLASRGIVGIPDRNMFLGSYESADALGLLNPFDLPDMEKTVSLIEEYIEREGKIFIYGDYDCDGILATASLYNYLSQIGADAEYFINERSDGYGMNINNVRKLSEAGADLIITVDNGISAAEEAKLCKELGIKLIITDHHLPPETLPEADAIVDPHITSADNKTKFRDLCGCAVVLKLITALEDGQSTLPVEMMSDFAAIATIADVMPIVGENRNIVRHGLHYIPNTENEGLKALINELSVLSDGKKREFVPTVKNIAFGIAPRINASGRLGSAMEACELFTTDDPAKAEELAKKLCDYNNARRSVEDKILSGIETDFSENPELFHSPVIVSAGRDWNKGVIGIDAARVMEKTGKPTFIISIGNDGLCTGSARSPDGFSVFDSLKASEDLLTRFGGHKGAGGFSLAEENINAFRERLCGFSGGKYYTPELHAVKAISPEEITLENIEALLNELSPFGEKNPEPVFLVENAEITSVKSLSGGKYTKVTIDCKGSTFSFPLFKIPFAEFPYVCGERINIMASFGINEYNGRKTVSLTVCDMRRTGVNQTKILNGEAAYRNIKAGIFPADKKIISAMLPSRDNFAAVYRLIPPSGDISEDFIMDKLCGEINTCVLHVILDALWDAGLVSRTLLTGRVKRLPVEKGKKADLNETSIIKIIREKL